MMEDIRKDPHITCLYGQAVSGKNHPVIAFRGILDEVMALGWLIASTNPGDGVVDVCAREIALRCQEILSAEYAGRSPKQRSYPLAERPREMSHNPMEFFGVPHFFGCELTEQGLCQLNLLRTRVRAAERAAVVAFQEKQPEYVGLLNQMSSYVYCCMCILQKRSLEEAR